MQAANEGGKTVSVAVPDEISRVVEAPVVDALSKWLTESGTALEFDRWITPGLSGARLATVVLKRPGEAVRGVLMKICPPGRVTGKEAARHAAALVDAPEFAAAHLVTQPIPPVAGKGGWSIMFQEVAGGSMRSIRPLSSMRGGDLPYVTTAIVSSILTGWNPTPETNRQGPVTFFRDHLGTRVVAGGPVDQFAEQIVYGSTTDASPPMWVRSRAGAVVPNAIAWACSEAWATSLATDYVMVVVGHAHGDLHADNVLVPQKPKPDPTGYRLIDLAGYSSSAPLARDPIHLLLSLLVGDVAELTDAKRLAVSSHLVDPTLERPEHLQIAGLLTLADAVTDVTEQFAAKLGLLDHWQDQTILSVAANALMFAIRLTDPAMKQWCLDLSCTALRRYCANQDIAVPTSAPTAVVRGAQTSVPVDSARAFEDLAISCDDWSTVRTTVLIIDTARLTPEACTKISALRWKFIVDLNPATNVEGGGWAAAAGLPGDRRLIMKDQDAFFGRSSTVWFAAAGLSDAESVDPVKDVREWRRKHFRFVARAIEALAGASSHPAAVVCIGAPRSAERAIVEACVDAFGNRATVTLVAASDTGLLSDYATKTIHCDPDKLLQAVPERGPTAEMTWEATLPGRTGRIVLPSELISRYADSMDLLHSELGLQGDRGVEPGAFYKGRPITWYELDLGLDVNRRAAADLVNDVLRPNLHQRGTLRVTLAHTPGAGGTTIARRATWDLKDEYPTLYVRGDIDEIVFVQAVSELALLCDMSVLVVAEFVPETTVRKVFEGLRASSVPAVLLVTMRRSAPRGQAREQDPDSEIERRDRTVRVGALSSPQERLEMARRFAALAPERTADLLELAARANDNNVPFFYALTAFGDDFEGLTSYVAQFLADLTPAEREILILISLCHRFCGVPVPAELFAELLHIPPADDVDLLGEIRGGLGDLLIEEPERAWRTTHSLVAEELLRQLLSPSEGTPGRDDWKASLPAWSLRLIDHASILFGQWLPEDVKSIIARLFTARESREPVEPDGVGAATYTDLMQIMSAPGRLQILKALVAAFAEEPHYWAHLGRMLSYDAGDFVEALAAADRAIALSPDDPLLHHMRGMVFRNEMRNRIRDRSDDPAQHERQILDLCQSANDAFRTVSALDDTTEFGHIALAQTNIAAIDHGYRLSGSTKYALFLASVKAGRYRDLLADAEESLDAASEIRGADRASYAAETAGIEITKFYDDYSALLQGWRNLLERADLAQPPIRRRLARAYRNRAGSWRKASAKDVRQAVGLLEENLLDNPRDARSLLEWLWAARFTGASLDKAADLVAGWARADDNREALFYDYVISLLLAMDGQESAIADYQRKLERCRERAAWFGNRRFPYEWLGNGTGLGRLVHHSGLTEWERRSGTPAPAELLRVPGRVHAITKSTSGTIDLGHGISAFVVPSASDLLRGRDENARITALVAFRYDGPMAFNIQKLE